MRQYKYGFLDHGKCYEDKRRTEAGKNVQGSMGKGSVASPLMRHMMIRVQGAGTGREF